jgi:ketosteroid isomerase-like protein
VVKRCPTCNKTFTDRNLSFCVDDGTPLVLIDPVDDEATVVRPSPSDDLQSSSAGSSRTDPKENGVSYFPAYVPPGTGPRKRSSWPLMLGILVVVLLLFGGLGIAAVVFLPRALQRASNQTPQNINASSNANRATPNISVNNNANAIANTNSTVDESSPAPTDREAVLASLKSLEDEWTVANINADKKKLNLILADDYVGISEGRAQGKAEYLNTIERDTAIRQWEFSDLKVTLTGDRAALRGGIRLDVKDEKGQDRQLRYQFTDKFVWREGRWQATSSEVNPIKDESQPVNDGRLSKINPVSPRRSAVEV